MATNPNAVVRFHSSDMICTRRYQCIIYDWTGSAQSRCRLFFLREHTLKMYTRAFEWPHTRKLQYFKICCHFCCRSRNRRMFCDRNRCHNPTEHIRRNGPSTSHYTSMYGQHNSRWNCKWHHQAAAITRNEYALFLDLWPKNLKKSHCMESRTIKSCRIFYKTSFYKTS